MKKIEAALPALGNYVVPFHKESEEVLNFLGDKELRRLDRVQHLGVASKVFAGVNHSRLEYVLLQCAVINLISKFQKGDENFAVGGPVRIPGQNEKMSSGEELLKCWALLSNFGHAQYTYGVERSLLNHARLDEKFRTVMVSSLPPKLRQWGLEVIASYRDTDFHFILALNRIAQLPPHSRVKGRLNRVLSALLLPLEQLTLTERADHFKLFRLRRLFSQVRLLCIVALDSYYSHHPVRLQVSAALMNIGVLMDETEEKSGFSNLIQQTAGWLADELYMHPRAATAQKHYELVSGKKLLGKLSRHTKSIESFRLFFPNLMETGFGQPQVDALVHLARLSLPRWRFGAVFGKDEYQLTKAVEAQLSDSVLTHVSVLSNPFTGMVHFDLLYDREKATGSSISDLYANTYRWLSRLIEAQTIWRIRALRIREPADKAAIERLRIRVLSELVDSSYPAIKSLFSGLIRYLLPTHLIGVMSEVMPIPGHQALAVRFKFARGGEYDSFSKQMLELVETNTGGWSDDRIHELRAVEHFVSGSKAPFVLVCLEKFIIRDTTTDGRYVDDWDGIVVEIYDKRVCFSVIEAKNLQHAAASENKAFQQLNGTKVLICKKHRLSARRKRIPKLGAVLTVSF